MNSNKSMDLANLRDYEQDGTNFRFRGKLLAIPRTNSRVEIPAVIYGIEKELFITKSDFDAWKKQFETATPKKYADIVRNRIINLQEVGDVLFTTDTTREIISQLTYKKSGSSTKNYAFFIFFGIPEKYISSIIEHLMHEGLILETKIKMINNFEFINYKMPILAMLQQTNNKIFLISEFNEKNNFINKLIKNSLEEKDFECIVMNIDHKLGNIDLAIKKHIFESEYVISNLSHTDWWNPNVFYEMGMASALNKKIIMFILESQFPNNSNKLPFDINSHTCLMWRENFENELINEILKIVN